MKLELILSALGMTLRDLYVETNISIDRLERFNKGKDILSLNELNMIADKLGVSYQFLVKGEPSNSHDRDVLSSIKYNDKKFKEKLIENVYSETNIKLFDYSFTFFDFETKKVNAEELLRINDAKLFGYFSKHYEIQPNMVNGNQCNNWDDVCEQLLGSVGDRFSKDFIPFAKPKGKDLYQWNKVLDQFRDGKLEFDPKLIVYVLEQGATLSRVIGTDWQGNAIESPDVFATRLLRKYCEDLLK